MRSRRTLIGRTKWRRSGTRLRVRKMPLTVVITTNSRLEVQSPTTHPRLVPPRRVSAPKFLRPSKRKDRRSPSGTPLPRATITPPRTALLESSQRRSSATTPSSVVSTQRIPSKSSSKRKRRRHSSRTRDTRDQLLVLLRRRKLIRTESTLAIYPIFTRILLSD